MDAAGLALIAFVTPGNLYLGTPVGLIGLLLSAAFAIWLMATGRLNPEPHRMTETTNVRA